MSSRASSLFSSCLMVMICCTADVSVQSMTNSFPLIPMKYSMALAVKLFCQEYRYSQELVHLSACVYRLWLGSVAKHARTLCLPTSVTCPEELAASAVGWAQ